MRKTIEAMWREEFLNQGSLVAPKVNDLYARKSRHIVDRIQRMQRINEIAIVIGAPIVWALLSSFVESNPDLRLVNGVPLVLIAGVLATAMVVDLLGDTWWNHLRL